MKIKKTIFKMAMLTMMVFAVVSHNDKIAGASNYADTRWEFYVNVFDTSDRYTEDREKEDSTKVYMNWVGQSNVSELRVMVEGSPDKTYHYNCTYGATYFPLYQPGQYSLSNIVYESGYDYARLRMRSGEGSGYVSGLWSPDSLRNYNIK